MTRVLMVTHNPYWKRDRGSRQRIASLVGALRRAGVEVHACFVGNLSNEDTQAALETGLRSIRTSGSPEPTGRTLRDFECDKARACFGASVSDLAPHMILIQQIRHAYLAAELDTPTPRRPVLAIDTHDVMYERAVRFEAAGHAHWLDITRDQEARALGVFDLILAIQHREARVLASMVPRARVMCVPHAIDAPSVGAPETPGHKRVGFVGISNAPNTDAAERLITEVWPRVRAALGQTGELHIAGSVCDRILARAETIEGVTLCGFVADLDAFYANMDVIATPIAFGGGLNIKNVEALARGIPLVTSPVGGEGLASGAGLAFLVAHDDASFASSIARALTDRPFARELGSRGRAFARDHFSPEVAYRPLLDQLTHPAESVA